MFAMALIESEMNIENNKIIIMIKNFSKINECSKYLKLGHSILNYPILINP